MLPYPIAPIYFAGTPTIKVYEIEIPCPVGFTIKDVRGRAKTAPSGGDCIIDIRDDGASIFSDQSEMVKIADGTNSDTSAVKDHVVAVNSVLTVEFEAVNGAADVTIVINGYAPLQVAP